MRKSTESCRCCSLRRWRIQTEKNGQIPQNACAHVFKDEAVIDRVRPESWGSRQVQRRREENQLHGEGRRHRQCRNRETRRQSDGGRATAVFASSDAAEFQTKRDGGANNPTSKTWEQVRLRTCVRSGNGWLTERLCQYFIFTTITLEGRSMQYW